MLNTGFPTPASVHDYNQCTEEQHRRFALIITARMLGNFTWEQELIEALPAPEINMLEKYLYHHFTTAHNEAILIHYQINQNQIKQNQSTVPVIEENFPHQNHNKK